MENNKIDKNNRMKIIRSSMKSINIGGCDNRSSYVTFENSLSDNDNTMIVIFEVTTSKIYFTGSVLHDLSDQNDKYTTSMKKLIHKLC